jgi:hypothetical protein
MSKIYMMHENNEWAKPLKEALEEAGLPYEDWFLDQGTLDLSEEPPKGVFYSRMSASSHTRNHPYAVPYTAAVLAWLEAHDRRVINKSRALQLEVSKVAQYSALQAQGILVPKTVAAVGKEEIVKAARVFEGPFITKHNCGGKGLGVQLFRSLEALEEYVHGPGFDSPVDGITLIQEYIEPPEPYITRCEFIGGKLYYAVQVDTSEGFQLCPADSCQVGDAFCPVGETQTPKFKIIEGFQHPIVEKYEAFLKNNDIEIAGIEFIKNSRGELYTYDINTNTNYNPGAEAVAGMSALKRVAEFLGSELKKVG